MLVDAWFPALLKDSVFVNQRVAPPPSGNSLSQMYLQRCSDGLYFHLHISLAEVNHTHLLLFRVCENIPAILMVVLAVFVED